MLKGIKRRQQDARRESSAKGWKLYTTPAGNVPKELVAMFAGISTSQIPNPPRVILTPAENEVLRRSLDFIDRHGVRSLGAVSDETGSTPPRIKKVKSTEALWELKIQSGSNNPRFIFVDCNGIALFVDAFQKKQQKLSKKDIERSEERYKTVRGDCK